MLFLFSVQATEAQHCRVLRGTQHWSHRVTNRGFQPEMENRDTYTEWQYSYATHIIAGTQIWKHCKKSYALYMYVVSSQLYTLRRQSNVDRCFFLFFCLKKEMNTCVRMSVNANVSSRDRSLVLLSIYLRIRANFWWYEGQIYQHTLATYYSAHDQRDVGRYSSLLSPNCWEWLSLDL